MHLWSHSYDWPVVVKPSMIKKQKQKTNMQSAELSVSLDVVSNCINTFLISKYDTKSQNKDIMFYLCQQRFFLNQGRVTPSTKC